MDCHEWVILQQRIRPWTVGRNGADGRERIRRPDEQDGLLEVRRQAFHHPQDLVDLVAADADGIERCSRALSAKYRPGGSLRSMLLPHTLPTTLLLEPA